MMTRADNRSRRTLDESGSAIVIALVVMSLMLVLGLAALAMTDTQTSQSRLERVRESSFNLAEGGLQQQSFLLGGRGWPRLATDALPAACNQSSDPALTANRRCPTPSALVTAAGTGAYDEPDYASGASWTTYVRDNTAVNNKVYTSSVDGQRNGTPTRTGSSGCGPLRRWVPGPAGSSRCSSAIRSRSCSARRCSSRVP